MSGQPFTGRREGLDVRAAYVHDLGVGHRSSVPVDEPALAAGEQTVSGAALRLPTRDHRPNPGMRCRRCGVRNVCSAAR